ncbi:hypothetical protein NECAME_08958 [Necator americanus]|nr:hypothetical protein NECAME_08958 [Necator americanus]ETN80752.1 hypothetical protein NECAME_08958 [Necator americanus]
MKKRRAAEVYTKGFVPLPKQKYAKNYEDSDCTAGATHAEAYEDGGSELCDRSSHHKIYKEEEDQQECDDQSYSEFFREKDHVVDPQACIKRDHCKNDYGSHSCGGTSLDRRKRRRRAGKKHKKRLVPLERTKW